MPISLTKIEQTAPGLLSLAKKSRSAIDAKGLNGQTAKLALVLDYSLSMTKQYKDGSVQDLAERVLAFGTQLDDDGAVDLFIFDREAVYLGEVNINNFRGVIDKYTAGRRKGSTNYAAAFTAVAEHYDLEAPLNRRPDPNWVAPAAEPSSGGLRALLRKTPAPPPPVEEHPLAPLAPLETPAAQPVLAVFLTDGVPDSRTQAVTVITALSFVPIFWQFISIGKEEIPFLVKLDDLKGRHIDNADYKAVRDITDLTEDTLLGILLDEYPAWVIEQKRRGQIA
ncbi:MAG: tellurium resistance protein [Glaciihabitans sp.]|nr:tellurium resistance protein [Glaciihabitans sp.]